MMPKPKIPSPIDVFTTTRSFRMDETGVEANSLSKSCTCWKQLRTQSMLLTSSPVHFTFRYNAPGTRCRMADTHAPS